MTLPTGDVPDDAIMPTSSSGTFYISNQGGNDIISVQVAGLNTHDLYADITDANNQGELIQIDPNTGVVTPIVTGLTAPHGLAFVPSASPPQVSGPTEPEHSDPDHGHRHGAGVVVEGEHILATAPTGSKAPDSITIGGGSIWVEYGNGADSTGASGSSTIVQYSMIGQVVILASDRAPDEAGGQAH